MNHDTGQHHGLDPGTEYFIKKSMITDNAGTVRCASTVTELPLKSGHYSISDLLKAIKTGQEDGPLQKNKVPLKPGKSGMAPGYGM